MIHLFLVLSLTGCGPAKRPDPPPPGVVVRDRYVQPPAAYRPSVAVPLAVAAGATGQDVGQAYLACRRALRSAVAQGERLWGVVTAPPADPPGG